MWWKERDTRYEGYSLDKPYGDLSSDKPQDDQWLSFAPESYRLAKAYLAEHLLSYENYVQVWQPIVDRVFEPQAFQLSKGPTHRPGYEGMAMFNEGKGFPRRSFLALQRCMRAVGDTHFIVVDDVRSSRRREGKPLFRMIYPVDIAYEDFWRTDLGLISLDMGCDMGEEYLVVGNSGAWGKYAVEEAGFACSFGDCFYPLDLIGFLPVHTELFSREFGRMISNDERKRVHAALPPSLCDHYMRWLPEVTEVDPLTTSKSWYV